MIKRTLQELCLNITDGKHGDCENEGNSGYYFISCKDIFDGQINYKNARQITKADFEETHKRTMLEVDDILLTNSGTIGRMAFVTDREATTKTTFQKSVAIIKPDKQKVLPRYLYYQLQNCVPQFINSSNGSAQKNLLLSTMRTFQIEIEENREKQEKIANTLSAYDDLIENNQKQIKLLEEAAQRLYKEWFVDLRFPGHENTEIVDGVPEGWNECTVESFGTVITGKTPPTSNKEYYTNGKVPFVTIPDMHNVVYPLKTEKRLTIEGAQTQKNKYIPPNGVMISCIGTVGLVSIATEVCQTNQQINSIILNNEDDLYFFYESMLRMKDLLDGLGSNGATMTNINKSKLEKLIIISPSKDIVKQYNDVCKPLFESALNLSRKNVYLKNMREALLPKLMSGEVEV